MSNEFATLLDVFKPDVLERLAAVRRPGHSPFDDAGKVIRERHVIVGLRDAKRSRARWAKKKAWSRYLEAASQCGLLMNPELRSRLIGDDDNNFRGAMAECLVAWFFMHHRGAKIRPRPGSAHLKNIDMIVECQGFEIGTEVKAPYVPVTSRGWAGGDEDTLLKALKKAGEQFGKGTPNLLVVVPNIRTPICAGRYQLLKATIGESVMNVPVSLDGSPVPEPTFGFRQNGKLARRVTGQGQPFRTELTRISAVMSIEELLMGCGRLGRRINHRIVVVHNPYAEHPIPRDLFGRAPQWVAKNGLMGWSDGQPVF